MSGVDGRLLDYLSHIEQAIARIETYAGKATKEDFLGDQLLQDAIVRNLEIVGEASRNILRRYPDFAETNSNLPLKSAYEMRNALAHGYFEVDLDIVWQTIVGDLSSFARQISNIRDGLGGNH